MKERLRFKDGEGNDYPDWAETTLGEVCEIVMGQSPESKYYNIEENGVPLIQGNLDMVENKTISRIWTTNIAKRALKGDLLMTVRAPIGKLGYVVQSEVCIGRGVCAFKGLKNKYLFHYLALNEELLNNFGQGSTFTAINSSDLKNLPLALPCLEEQEKIASFLSTVDEAIETKKEELDLRRKYKKGAMQKLFRQELRFKDAEGKDYPDWEETTLGEVGEVNPESISNNDKMDKIDYVDIASVSNGKLRETTTYEYSQMPSRARRKIKEGDTIISTVRVYNKSYLYITKNYENKIASTGFAVIRANKKINKKFQYYIITQDETIKYLENVSIGSNYPAFKTDSLAAFPLFLPCLEEQEKIASFLSTVDEAIETAESQLELLTQHKKALMQRLFTKP